NSRTLLTNQKIETAEFRQYVTKQNPSSLGAKLFNTAGITPRIEDITKQVDCCSLDGRAVGTWYQPGIAVGQAIGNGPDGIPDWAIADLFEPPSGNRNQINGSFVFNGGDNNKFLLCYFLNIRCH